MLALLLQCGLGRRRLLWDGRDAGLLSCVTLPSTSCEWALLVVMELLLLAVGYSGKLGKGSFVLHIW